MCKKYLFIFFFVFSFIANPSFAISPAPEGCSPEGSGDYCGCLIVVYDSPDFKAAGSEEIPTEETCFSYCSSQDSGSCAASACFNDELELTP